ncbi:serine/threonine-protein phosphatase [Actinacidiphila glaucinigra]|uniref:PP2C family protein-serine/threonine phosphatase n=1 Tax=Actinacidiphila glaucinigra TaxID=235986 RepID=UPI002DD9541F|nr:PP2C family protein-serine/threonine phosphatase [Actinacidiphila glaucinigra]WSD64205.1 serine/threonine-protein phosphatase [Actinacidiphila glaucinigra]
MEFGSRLSAMQDPVGSGCRVFLAVMIAIITAVPIADHFLPEDIHLAHVLVVPVALASAFTGAVRGALTGLAAVLALVAAGAERHTLSSENVLVQLGSLVLLFVLLVLISALRERRRHELQELREVSRATQGVLLRPLPTHAGPVTIATAYRSAGDGDRIGGDLYAVARTARATRLLIGDVRGKGLCSIGDTETVLGAFRAAAHRQEPLAELMESLEAGVRWELTESWDGTNESDVGERFVTAAVVEIPDDEPYVRVVSCGHLPPILLHDGTVTTLDVPEPAPPLGLGGLTGSSYAPTAFPFALGDRLLLYTDGVTEARNGAGEFYPLMSRVAEWADRRPDQLVRKVTDDLLAHVAAPLQDDMAVVAILRDALGGPPPRARAHAGADTAADADEPGVRPAGRGL